MSTKDKKAIQIFLWEIQNNKTIMGGCYMMREFISGDKRRRLLMWCLSLALVMIAVAQITSTSVANETINAELHEKEIISNMISLGIEDSVQERLLEKIRNGETLDCHNIEKVKQVAGKLSVSKDKPIAEHTFPDGSKIVLEISIEEEVAAYDYNLRTETFIVYPRVEYSDPIINCEYRAKVRLYAHYPDSYFYSVYDRKISMIMGTYSDVNLAIITNPQPSHSGYARSRLSFDATYKPAGIPVWTKTAWLELWVSYASYHTTFNLY